MIAALKFSHRPAIARIAGELLAGYLRTRCSTVVAEPELLVPVPLHPLRWRERGYNQAELIAATVADRLRLHCSADVLRRDRNTAAQTRFGRERRQRNLRAAFSVQKNVSGLRIALVDDVITTGATAAACVGELLHAGAADVQVWAVARTITGFQKYS